MATSTWRWCSRSASRLARPAARRPQLSERPVLRAAPRVRCDQRRGDAGAAHARQGHGDRARAGGDRGAQSPRREVESQRPGQRRLRRGRDPRRTVHRGAAPEEPLSADLRCVVRRRPRDRGTGALAREASGVHPRHRPQGRAASPRAARTSPHRARRRSRESGQAYTARASTSPSCTRPSRTRSACSCRRSASVRRCS
jgi:hypothetical protein